MNRVPPIDSIDNVGELESRDADNAGGRRWPDEAALLQPLGVERHADAVMPQNLDQVAPHAPEHVEITSMGVAPESFLDLQSQSIHAAPHVGSPDRQPHPYTRRHRNHRRSRASTSVSGASAAHSRDLMGFSNLVRGSGK